MTREQITTLITNRLTGTQNRTASERTLWTAIMNESCKLYEVKEIDINLTLNPNFITDNFDNTGLGKNAYEGFAICNGQNGTRDRRGRSSLGYYLPGYNVGDIGGFTDAIVVAHTHTVNAVKSYSNQQGVNGFYDRSTNASPNGIVTESTGSSGVGRNYHPYVVTLMIQRIA